MSKLLVERVMRQGRGGSGSKTEVFSWEERGSALLPLRRIGAGGVEDSSLLRRFLSSSAFLAFAKDH